MKITPADWSVLSPLVDTGLELPVEHREAWLRDLELEPPVLKEALRALLAAAAACEAGGFLAELPRFETRAPSGVDASTAGLAPGASVGPYVLDALLGRGGMGSVWRAHRTDQLQSRSVALKVPYAGYPGRELAARLAREREILAALEHPHIARLYDAGVTAAGQPYLALQFVEGVPITEYCARERLPVAATLTLFLQLLEAAQYAHSRLVVHRDIKPSNILVTPQGDAVLLDFGIAKLLTDGTALETELTQLGGRALTLGYASPEQITGGAVTIASDVYSLGVVLYELLTGQRPYRPARDSRAALEEAILAGDPPPPSRTLAQQARRRPAGGTAPGRVAALHSDLDSVLLKALKKDPSDRYATADAFRQDLERYLAGQPVQAKPDTLWYRSSRFLVRHRVAAGAAALILIALVAGLSVALWQARVAEEHARTAEAVQQFLEDLFEANRAGQANPELARQATARDLLDRGSAQIAAALNGAPAAKLRVLKTLSRMYHNLDLENRAAELARTRADLARSLYGPADARVAEALVDLGDAANSADLAAQAGQALGEAERILDRARDTRSTIRGRLDVQLAYHNSAVDDAKALSYAEQGIAILRPLGPSYDLALALSIKASVSSDRGRPDVAEAAAGEALAIAAALHGRINSLLPGLYAQLGYSQTELTQFATAEASLRQAVAAAQRVYGAETIDTLEMMRTLADFYFRVSRLADGLAVLAPARAVALSIAARGDTSVIPTLVIAKEAVGLVQYGRLEQAADDLRRLDELTTRNPPALPWVRPRLQEAAAWHALEAGDYATAHRLLDAAAAAETALGWDTSERANDNVLLRMQLLMAEGRAADATQAFGQLHTVDADSRPTFFPQLEQRVAAAELALARGDAALAASLARRARHDGIAPAQQPFLAAYAARALLVEGRAELRQGHAAAAMPLLEEAAALATRLYDPAQSPRVAAADAALATCYAMLGNRRAATDWRARAAAILDAHARIGAHYRERLREVDQALR